MKHQSFQKPNNFLTKKAANRVSKANGPSDPALFERFSCQFSYLKWFKSYDIKRFFLHSRFGKRSVNMAVVQRLRTRPWTSVNTTEAIRRFLNMALEVKKTVTEVVDVRQHN